VTASDEQSVELPKLRFDILTIFPSMFAGPFGESILKRAIDQGLIQVNIHDIRDWTTDRHRTVDDTPYGGGAGMVMKAPPIVAATEHALGDDRETSRVVILSPAGRLFDQDLARDLSHQNRLILICGRYEGIDDRVREELNAEEISIGDYVITGGELAAMVVVDAVARLIPGVITAESTTSESHDEFLVEYPHYTRPPNFRGRPVPDVLMSGHHAEIANWRRAQSLRRTAEQRPDLISKAKLTAKERADIDVHTSGPPSQDE
jgi:tRNA (guanine37-N1)-methyltransferase